MNIKNKKVIKILVTILLIFSAYSLLWCINSMFYEKPTQEYEKFDGYYVKTDENGFSYTLSKPGYLSFTGNYAITNSDDTLSILVWPHNLFNKNDIYGIQIYNDINQHGYMFYVDKKLQYTANSLNKFSKDEINEINELLKLNAIELNKMNKIIEKEWKL